MEINLETLEQTNIIEVINEVTDIDLNIVQQNIDISITPVVEQYDVNFDTVTNEMSIDVINTPIEIQIDISSGGGGGGSYPVISTDPDNNAKLGTDMGIFVSYPDFTVDLVEYYISAKT